MSVHSRSQRSLWTRLATLVSLPALVLAVLAGMTGALATGAAAHDTIVDTVPAHDAVLDAAPAEVVLTFSAEVLDLPAAIIVTDANGEVVVEGEPTVEGQSVVLALPPSLANGAYQVLWSVVSSDGHRTEDVYNFTVASSDPVASGESESDPQATTSGAPTDTPAVEPTAQTATRAPVASPVTSDQAVNAATSGWPIGAVIVVPIAILALALVAAFLYRRRRQN